jgi:hypothetical protein
VCADDYETLAADLNDGYEGQVFSAHAEMLREHLG